MSLRKMRATIILDYLPAHADILFHRNTSFRGETNATTSELQTYPNAQAKSDLARADKHSYHPHASGIQKR